MCRLLIVLVCVLGLFSCKKDTGGVSTSTAIAAQAAIDKKKILAYLSANNLTNVAVKVGAPKTDTIDVWYIVRDTGTVTTAFTNSTQITVGYTASVLGGNVFTQTNDYHPTYTLGAVIKGWQLGIMTSGIKKGGTLELIMASRYAYGPYPQPEYNLPANSVLDFVIDFYNVTN